MKVGLCEFNIFISLSTGQGGREEGVAIGVEGLVVEDITSIMIKRRESKISLLAVWWTLEVPRGFLLANPRRRLYS